MPRQNVTSEVSGTVWKIEVAPGATVSAGDTLLIIESMKMEIAVTAPAPGIVSEILVQEEQPVTQGQALAAMDC